MSNKSASIAITDKVEAAISAITEELEKSIPGVSISNADAIRYALFYLEKDLKKEGRAKEAA